MRTRSTVYNSSLIPSLLATFCDDIHNCCKQQWRQHRSLIYTKLYFKLLQIHTSNFSCFYSIIQAHNCSNITSNKAPFRWQYMGRSGYIPNDIFSVYLGRCWFVLVCCLTIVILSLFFVLYSFYFALIGLLLVWD